mgnify:FL=1
MANIIVQRKSSFYPVIESSEIERIADDIIDEVMPILHEQENEYFLEQTKMLFMPHINNVLRNNKSKKNLIRKLRKARYSIKHSALVNEKNPELIFLFEKFYFNVLRATA